MVIEKLRQNADADVFLVAMSSLAKVSEHEVEGCIELSKTKVVQQLARARLRNGIG